MKIKKILGLIGIIACVLLLILTAFRIISWTYFWIGIILIAIFAYWILPKMKNA